MIKISLEICLIRNLDLIVLNLNNLQCKGFLGISNYKSRNAFSLYDR